MATRSFAPGTFFVDQVAASDHAPLAALVTVGFAQKSGTPPGTPCTMRAWLCSCAASVTVKSKTMVYFIRMHLMSSMLILHCAGGKRVARRKRPGLLILPRLSGAGTK